jgi:NAD(P)-dependent dehydrogenase (short-subunit alcohol dehydrogenase family)
VRVERAAHLQELAEARVERREPRRVEPVQLPPVRTALYAVVGISETLRLEGAAFGLGVSVLCPGAVRTRILESERNRPRALGESKPVAPALGGGANPILEGLDPLAVGRRVRDAVLRDELYVFTHPGTRALFERRVEAMRAGFDAADAWRDDEA